MAHMPKSSFEKLDEPFSENGGDQPSKNKPEKPLPDFDLNEPFAEDTGLEQAALNLDEAEWQAASEALARQAEIRKQIELEALKIGSERERGQDREVWPKERESEAQYRKRQASSACKIS